LSPGSVILHGDLGQAAFVCLPMSPSSIILVPTKRQWCLSAGKVTVGLVESNDSLVPGLW